MQVTGSWDRSTGDDALCLINEGRQWGQEQAEGVEEWLGDAWNRGTRSLGDAWDSVFGEE